MDNLDKLLEALDHPEKFSREEIEKILSDPDTRQLYEILTLYRSGSFVGFDLDEKDVEKEWEKFIDPLKNSTTHKTGWSFFRKFAGNRTVAAVIVMVVLSCSIVAVGVSLGLRFRSDNPKEKLHEEYPVQSVSSSVSAETSLSKDTIILFEEEKLDVIIGKVAPYYGVKIEHKSSQSKDVRLFLRWNSSMPLDEFVEHLNSFDRINLTLNDSILTIY